MKCFDFGELAKSDRDSVDCCSLNAFDWREILVEKDLETSEAFPGLSMDEVFANDFDCILECSSVLAIVED